MTTVGLQPVAGVALGFAPYEELDLSVLLQVAHRSFTQTVALAALDFSEEVSYSITSIELAPGIDYVFAPGASVRPFVGARAGLRHDNFGESAVFVDSVEQESSTSALVLGVAGGVHLFLGADASLEVLARVSYAKDFTGAELSLVDLGAAFGVTAWWGGCERAP